MITEDGFLVAHGPYFGNFFKRCHTMWLVLYCMCSKELRKTLRPRWMKFFSVALQYIFVGRYRCLEGKELEEWNNANVRL